MEKTTPIATATATANSQLNIRLSQEVKDLIIKKATTDYGLTVADFVIGKCLDKLTAPVLPTSANVPEAVPMDSVEYDTEKEALNDLVRRQREQILTLTAEKQELMNLQISKAVEPTVTTAPVNEFAFIVSPELKTLLEKIEAYRAKENIAPAFKDCFEYIILPWAENMYSGFKFTKNTGIDYSELKEALSIQREYLNKFMPAMGSEVVEKK
jgi:hypothetical protein